MLGLILEKTLCALAQIQTFTVPLNSYRKTTRLRTGNLWRAEAATQIDRSHNGGAAHYIYYCLHHVRKLRPTTLSALRPYRISTRHVYYCLHYVCTVTKAHYTHYFDHFRRNML